MIDSSHWTPTPLPLSFTAGLQQDMDRRDGDCTGSSPDVSTYPGINCHMPLARRQETPWGK